MPYQRASQQNFNMVITNSRLFVLFFSHDVVIIKKSFKTPNYLLIFIWPQVNELPDKCISKNAYYCCAASWESWRLYGKLHYICVR